MLKSWSVEMKELFFAHPDDIEDKSGALVKMGYFAAEQEWTDTEIFGLVNYLDGEVWYKYTTRKDRLEILTDIIERVRRKIPYGANDIMFRGLTGIDSTSLNPQVWYNLRQFKAEKFTVNWFFKDLLSRKGYMILFGPSGIGKTQLALQLCADAAGGRDFLEWENECREGCRVLFLSLEMTEGHLQFFINQQSALHDSDTVLDNFNLAFFDSPIMLDLPEGKNYLEKILKTLQPDLLVIDSYAMVISGSLSEDLPNRKMARYLASIRARFDLSMVILHHTNKLNIGPELEMTDFFGSVYIYTTADSVLGVGYQNKSSPDEICLSQPKSRLARPIQPTIINREVGLIFKPQSLKDLKVRINDVGKAQRANGVLGVLLKEDGEPDSPSY
jgi:hypothetical protein